MRAALAICILCVAASLPPMPKPHKRPAAADITTKGAGAKALMAPSIIIVKPALTNELLTWPWTNMADAWNATSNIVFVIRTNATPMGCRSWSVMLRTNAVNGTNSVKRRHDFGAPRFYFVQASNTLTHLQP